MASKETKEYFKTKLRKLRDAAETISFQPQNEEIEKAKVVLNVLDYLEGTEKPPITLTTEKKK